MKSSEQINEKRLLCNAYTQKLLVIALAHIKKILPHEDMSCIRSVYGTWSGIPYN